MICPNCGKNILHSLPNVETVVTLEDHRYGICQYCKEIVHFFSDPNENIVYGWKRSGEWKYRSKISFLKDKNYILFINKCPEQLFDLCMKFHKKFGSNIGFIVLERFQDQVEKIKNVYCIVVLDDILFPTSPSFLAEKLITETLPGKFFSLSETITKNFEVWND